MNHFDAQGQAHMVDVADKAETRRFALASGRIAMKEDTLRLIQHGNGAKGDVIGIARIAAIQATKRTSDLIPLAHPLQITSVRAAFEFDSATSAVVLKVGVECFGRTGVEMEALTAVSVGLLTIYDMCKAVDRGMTIGHICLLEKTGGKSGTFLQRVRKQAHPIGRRRKI